MSTDNILARIAENPCKKGLSPLWNCVFTLPSVWCRPYLSDQINELAAGLVPLEEKEMLNNIGLPGLLLIAVVVLVLFGRGKISSLMGEVGKGITAFKRGVDDGKKEIEDSMADAKDVTPAEDKDKV
jgi:sec-independent protein translocase protein TatA